MGTRILLFALALAGFSSCATYRTGQTPDDVYYSPAREVNTYATVDRDEDNRLSYNDRNLEDRRLRQQIRDPRLRYYEDYYWDSPRYGSWGWNTWNSPYNTWGWNNYNYWGSGYGWNNYYGHGGYYNNYWGYGYKGYPNYIIIPGGNNLIVVAGPGAPSHSSSFRYSSPVQRFSNAGSNFFNGKTNSGNNSRYFNNSNSGGRTGFFGGGSNNNSSSNSNWNTGSSSSSSSSGTGSRSYSGGSSSGSSSSSSSSSSSGSSSSGSSAGGRRN